jgi:hypothetical protein
MSPSVKSYLGNYILRRRMIALCGAMIWAAAMALVTFALLQCIGRLALITSRAQMVTRTASEVICLAIVGRALIRFWYRRNWTAAAIEIEQQIPQFDQRLITVASNPPDSPLLTQVICEVEAIAMAHRARVPLRPLLSPILALLAAGLALVICR